MKSVPLKPALLTAAITAACALPLSAAQAQDIKLGHVLAPTHSWNIAAEGFAKDVAEATEGRVNFQVFPSGQLGNEKTVVEGMQIGSVPAGVIGCGSFQPLDARFGIVELPYSWPDREHAYAAYDGKLGDALEDIADEHNMKILSWWENGFRHVTNNRGPITSPEDLAGLKIRVTPDKMRLDTFTALGSSPAPLSFGELYSALQQGVFDAQENPLAIIYSSSFSEVQDYVSLTGHVWAPACLTMSNFSWNQLSEQDQAAVQKSADEWRDKQRAMTQKDDAELVAKLEEAGMQVNEVDTAPFNAKVQGVWADYADVFGPELMGLVEQYRKGE
ncbi:DctP family TRAP transporter solute-binding subunit [Cobetia marina]|uniref:DctP family TRAP transporter solute-binding subunit n=1 Tax=Cobetia marina TaxID=28258 RepID=A0ABU9GEE4_COBMA|nr:MULTISPECIES: DctP family TRAP transporter solute-binding subunit [Cobetia]MDA5563316.1 DctP family TRAP transporter solute-binding subunit [Cobetia sp. MMG027]MDH2289820.1 DctP family TRAP transporter solute-binding subunit [Cobetia sp. 10Alg 146]MDH2373593.1 DctP family TRAP transporter solute-binding subunit [Cobetia sp. 3AK]MDI6003640.1 DctP family TRAP transporter solute-binding subunit [Cobetia pacifica]MDO6786483.1 DctP family TRAP transporter solute-binding subunit [Cobetia marina]